MYRGGGKGGCWALFFSHWVLGLVFFPPVVPCTARLTSPPLCSAAKLVSLPLLLLLLTGVSRPPTYSTPRPSCENAFGRTGGVSLHCT
jgi:hypothetical protein